MWILNKQIFLKFPWISSSISESIQQENTTTILIWLTIKFFKFSNFCFVFVCLRFWFQSKSSPIDLFIVYWSKDWLVYVHVDFRINYMSMICETIYYLDFYPIFPKYEILSLRRKKESIKTSLWKSKETAVDQA